jgi:hypothetical protein
LERKSNSVLSQVNVPRNGKTRKVRERKRRGKGGEREREREREGERQVYA